MTAVAFVGPSQETSRVAEIVNPVRLAYLTLEAPREGQASYTHVFEIIDGLRRRGFNVELYMPSYADRFELPNLVRRLLEHGRLQARLAMEWRGYDAVYVRGHNLAFPVAMLARVTGKPIVHEINGPHLDIAVTYPWIQPVHGLLSWMQRVQYRWADALVAVTPQLQRWLRLEGCTNSIEVIPNGANLAYFNPDLPKRVGLPARYVVFFGGFARWQGIATMLDAVRHPSWPSDVSLVIVGDGQMRPEVERAVLWTPRLQYLGRLPYREVGGVVAGAAAALVPKIREDDRNETGLFPVKLFEIMACGVPAIVSDYPGQADLVRRGRCGLVVPPGDASALAAAVGELAANPDIARAMGQRGYELVLHEHSWDARALQTARVIEQVLRKTVCGTARSSA